MTQGIFTYSRFERFWHWTQAALVLFLAVTGFEIHGSLTFLGYEQAVRTHRVAANALIVLIAFAIFWHFTTGEWRQYIPTRARLRAQIDYYLVGIFRGAPHPSQKTRLSKLNPLQRIVYLALKLLAFPVMIVSGLLHFPIAHTAGAYFLLSFVVAHVYLITTGETATSNLKAMLTGYEEREDEASCVPTT
jgi:thiosulfate reductase cytochrome b subunit